MSQRALNLTEIIQEAQRELIKRGYLYPTVDDALSYIEHPDHFPKKSLAEQIEMARAKLVELGHENPDTETVVAFLDDPDSFKDTGSHKRYRRISIPPSWEDDDAVFDGHGM
ncbi:MAG: hypothetical protein ACOYUZ_02220 [Patescibacteria group bacterium]